MSPLAGSIMRLRGLLRKEMLQIRRDPSSILLALVMPVVLLFLFGYGLSLNPTLVPVAIVSSDHGSEARQLLSRFELSPYFAPRFVDSLSRAEELVRQGRVDGIIQLQGDFSSDLLGGDRIPLQIIVNGVDANRARLIEGYALGAVQKWQAMR